MKSKKQSKLILISLKILLSLSIISCANIPAPDVPVFGTIDKDTAYYVYTISDKEGFVTNELPFYDERFMKEPMTLQQLIDESLWMPAFTYGELKKTLVKLCTKNKQDCYKQADPNVKAKKLEFLMKNKAPLR